MKTKLTICAVFLGVSLFASPEIPVEEKEFNNLLIEKEVSSSDWSLSLGFNFRTIKGVEFHAVSSAPGTYTNGTYENGIIKISDPTDPDDQVDGNGPFPGTSSIRLNSFDFSGADDDFGLQPSLLLEASTIISKHDKGSYNLDLSLGFMQLDDSFNLGTSSLEHIFIGTEVTPGDPSDGYNGSQASQSSSGVNASFDLEMNAWTLGAGVSQTFTSKEGFSLKLGFGPTLNIVDYDFKGPAISATGKVSSRSDSGVDVLLGFYTAATLSYAINSNWSVGSGVRYDWVEALTSEVVDVDLSGFSVEAKVTYSF